MRSADRAPLLTALAVAAVLVTAALQPLSAGVKVKVDADPAFDFTKVRTWMWNPTGAGEVKMARTAEDDPEAFKRRAEPIVVDEVTKQLAARGLTQASGYAADVTVTYFMLLTMNQSTQQIGQFLPAMAVWGLPPMAPATQSLELLHQGALVIDLSSQGTVVWRGVAQAGLKIGADEKKRTETLRQAVRDLVRKYPPKKK